MNKTKWVSLAVVPNFSWPAVELEIAYEGREFLLLPATTELACCAAVRSPPEESLADGGEAVLRLLSAYAWSEDAGIALLTSGSFIGSNANAPIRQSRGRFAASTCGQIAAHADLYLPAPTDPSARLALALYREGMSLDHFPFALLSFMRIINLRFGKWVNQVAWINSSLGQLTGQAATRADYLQATQSDVGQYLYGQGRCAVAHATSNSADVVHPDRMADWLRMSDDLPLVRALAAHCIEVKYGIPPDWKFRQDNRDSPLMPSEWLRLINGTGGRKRYQH